MSSNNIENRLDKMSVRALQNKLGYSNTIRYSAMENSAN